MFRLMIFLLFSASLFADDSSKKITALSPTDHSFPLVNIEGEPSSIVAGHVNVISGDFVDMQRDLEVVGSEPLIVERSYCSSDRSQLYMGLSWHLNIGGIIEYGHFDGKKYLIWKGPFGREIPLTANDKKNKKLLTLQKKIISDGVTNNSSGLISGKTNLNNIKVQIKPDANPIFHISTGDGSLLTVISAFANSIRSETKPNLMQLHYENIYWQGRNFIKNLTIRSPSGKDMQCIRLESREEPHKQFSTGVNSDDVQRVKYTFQKHFKKDGTYDYSYLTSVDRFNEPPETYSYKKIDNHPQIVQKNRPDGRFIQVRYHDRKKNQDLAQEELIGRVKEIYSPIGPDGSARRAYKFYYHFVNDKEDELIEGSCGVHDADNVKTDYIWDKNHRLKAVVRYTSDGRPYTSDNLHWDENGNLLSRVYSGGGSPLFCRRYHYDKFGNVTLEKLYGNITGLNQIALQIDNAGIPIENKCECYQKICMYSEDDKNNLLSEIEGSRSKNYTYLEGTDLVQAAYTVSHGDIVLRQFYNYDEDQALIAEVTDNGCSSNPVDLTGASFRKTRYLSPRKSSPWSVPEEIYEYCQDIKTDYTVLEKKLINSYDSFGKLTRQDVYGSDDVHAYSLFWQYDHKGRLIKEIDALGQVIERDYDANNNLIYEKGPRKDVYKRFHYDFSNRLIREEEVHKHGDILTTSHTYNFLSRKTSTTDIYGNTTSFAYDEFGRMTQCIQPAIVDHGPLVTSMSYDAMGNVICKVDPNGAVTRTEYTTRGQPCKITYPDGSFETMVYCFHGPLLAKRDRNGCSTYYERDYQDRVIETRYSAPDGQLLWTTKCIYDAFNLLQESDAMGHITYYSYDIYGRKIAMEKGESKETYEYDSLGRMIKKSTFYSDNEAIIKTFEYDLLDRVTQERTEESNGNIAEQINFRYNEEGQCTHKITYGAESVPKITETRYNSFGIAAEVIDPLGNITKTDLILTHRNTLKQLVRVLRTTDPLGNVTTTIKDAYGRDANVFCKDAHGQVTQATELYYDFAGNLIKTIEIVFTPDAPERQVVTSWTYDLMNQMTSYTKAVDTPDQKTTHYYYNAIGQLMVIENPSGKRILHTYHPDGSLAKYSSDDFEYEYTYDLNQRLIKVFDSINQTYTVREYDPNDNLVEEILANALRVKYEHDRSGRVVSMILPDNSRVHYYYEGILLKAVSKISPNGEELYKHTYDEHDYSCNVLSQTLIGKAGRLYNAYDLKDRTTLNRTSFTEEVIPLHGYDAVDNLLKKQFKDPLGTLDCSFSYDNLYQLTSETGLSVHDYAYDSLHNRLLKDNNSLTINDLNQTLTTGEAVYTYDADGNMTRCQSSKGDADYAYDTLGRLISFTKQGITTKYSYDSFNRRLAKSSNGQAYLYLYDDQDEIGCYTLEGTPLQLRTLGQGLGAEIGAAIAVELNSKPYAPIHDLNGNVIALSDTNGKLLENYRYSAFGEEQLFDTDGRQQTTATNPWRFSSKRTDAESGLVYFGRRYYDPSLGRWTTQDPLGIEAGPNLYAYVSNCPLTHFDMYGLYDCSNWFGFEDSNSLTSILQESSQNYLQINEGFNNGLYAGVQNPLCPIKDLWNGSYDLSTPHGRAELFGKTTVSMLSALAIIETGGALFQGLTTTTGLGAINAVRNFNFNGIKSFFSSRTAGKVTEVAKDVGLAKRTGITKEGMQFGKQNPIHKISQLEGKISEWLGSETKMIKNRAGDHVFLSKDMERRVRFDLNHPAPHRNPHGHVEEFINGKWVKSGPIYPNDVPNY